jgi:Zn-dependent peptidase ImmA (M78 family)/transcriptional regulator with XRE-family HTH domain
MFSTNLKSARIRSGLSLRALEDKIGKMVSAQAIGKYERAEMLPSTQVVEALATALGVATDFFSTKQTIELGTVEFRENSKRHQVDTNSITSTVHENLLPYLEVESLLGVSGTGWDQPKQSPYPVRLLAEAEWAAHKLRSDWELGNDPIPSLSEFLEERGFKIILCDLPMNIAGLTCFVSSSNGPQIPIIVTSSLVTGERQRFTIAHELGHLLLDIGNDDLNAEKVCDKFAGAFLMPERFLWDTLGRSRSNISIGELVSLKKFLGVSVQAIVYRCKDLGIISEHVYRTLYKEFSIRGWLRPPYSEPNSIELESPQRFKRLCLRALSEGMISKEKAMELLVIPEEEFDLQFYGQN